MNMLRIYIIHSLKRFTTHQAVVMQSHGLLLNQILSALLPLYLPVMSFLLHYFSLIISH